MTLLSDYVETVRDCLPQKVSGRVAQMRGLTIAAEDLPVPVGATCVIAPRSGKSVRAEVIGFANSLALLMPLDEGLGVAPGDPVTCVRAHQSIAVGGSMMGRVVNAMAEPIDGGPPITAEAFYPLHRLAPPAMQRRRIDEVISTGIRSIDGMITVGSGQRLGIFAGTGVGKSVLLGMVARYTSADVTVVGLVGERGREVQDFIVKDLGPEGLKRCVLVVSTSDESAAMRVRAGFAATAIAEFFRDRGLNVLLMMDSVTRVAMAQRQIGLAAGEPPATKGYTPSVFALLPRLLERSGRVRSGSITGFYSVLVEGDDLMDPICDAVRGIVDGHMVLARSLANRGHWPAVSVLDSLSRLMIDLVDENHYAAAQEVRRLMAVWQDIEDLVNIGAYAAGTNPEYDLAIVARPWIAEYLQQKIAEASGLEDARKRLFEVVERINKARKPVARPAAAPAPAKR
jgi:flagellum-specific ATP synthase